MAEQLAQLNANWRVADDPPQWTLERRNSATRWRAVKFIRERDHLLRRIDELCGDVDSQALEVIRSWPTGYVQWKCREFAQVPEAETAPHSAISPSEALDHQKQRDPPVVAAMGAGGVMEPSEAA